MCAALLGAMAAAAPASVMAQVAVPDVTVQPELQFLSPVPAAEAPLRSGVTVNGQDMTPAATAGGQMTSGVTVNGEAVATPALAPSAAGASQFAQGVDESQSVILVQKLQQENQRLTGENEELKHQVQQLQAMLAQLKPAAAMSSAAQPAAAPAAMPLPDQPAVVPAQPPAAQANAQANAQAGAPAADGPLDLSAIAAGLNPGTAAPAAPAPVQQPAAPAAIPAAPPAVASVPDGGSLGSGTNGPSLAPNTSAGLDPQIAFNTAYNYVVKRDFAKAQSALTQFLSTYPASPQAGSAGYWLGEVLYRQGDYKSAGDRFLKTYKAYPKSEKAPETLLMLGQSLNALGQPEAACSVYNKLGTDFPRLPGPVANRLKEGKKGAACG